METTKKEISIKLVKITTEQFAAFEENLTEANEIQLTTEIKFGFDKNKRLISVLPSFTFLSKNLPFLKIIVGCHFEINEAGWDSMLDTIENKLSLQVGFIRHLSVLAIGTARGVLHSKTENTEFNKYFLPTINVEELLTQDLVFNLND